MGIDAGAAWSCFSKGFSLDESMRYGDVNGQQYEYDSTVINHAQVSVGDILVIRDADLLHGIGIVERVDSWSTTKTMHRCPSCGSTKWQERKSLRPACRCQRCHHEFDEPLRVPKELIAYSASYADRWFPFSSPAPARALASVYAQGDQQNAIRRLQPHLVRELVAFYGGVEPNFYLQLRSEPTPIRGGWVDVAGRQRVGQEKFRERLLERYGNVCAVTGRQPEEVLDAAHLYTFAERPEHVETAGLLLRADVHRLFDRLLLTVETGSWCTRVAPGLLDRYPSTAALHGRPLEVARERRPDQSYLEEHWAAAMQRWKRLATTP